MGAGKLSYPVTFGDFEMNSRYAEDGELQIDDINDGSFTKLELFDFSRLQIRDQREGLHLLSGGDLGVASDVFRFVSAQGVINAPNDDDEALEDSLSELFRAFDVDESQIDNPDTVGAKILGFYTPTHHPPPGHRSPVHEYFLARSAAYPQTFDRDSTGMSSRFAVELVCPDPRRFLYDATTVTFSGTAGWSKTMPNWTTKMGRIVYPVINVITSGNGAANFTISAGGTQTLVLDLSDSDGAHFNVDCFTGNIRRQNGSAQDDWMKSSVAMLPFGIPAGGAEWHIGHTTNITQVTVVWHQARA